MKPITDREFEQLVGYIKANYGINLFHKKVLVIGRLLNYMEQNNFDSFSDYYQFIISDKTGKAATTLINRITTNHTFFMRESQHFKYFRDKVLPDYITKIAANKDLRIWSAGCSSGEEPYTLAMIINDHFMGNKEMWDTKILATDISTKVLESAVSGVYQTEQILPLPEKWRKKYFTKHSEDTSIVVDEIKNEVIFRKFNLIDDVFPFKKKFHAIFCRNVMIYFDNETKSRLIDKFYDHLEYGGYLFIGHAESINRNESKYKYILPSVYRKE
jgi:chemotaxis protein methyltransferase CheR